MASEAEVGRVLGEEKARFRLACSHFSTGVTAVTATTEDGQIAALTANSFTSVSLDPPMVLVCVAEGASSADIVRRASHVAIHVLGAGHEHVARGFAVSGTTGAQRLDGLSWTVSDGQAPYLRDCMVRFAGPVTKCVDAGDHFIVLVQAEHTEILTPTDPALLFFRGAFSSSDGSE